MTDLDNICEYFIWWPDKDNKDSNKQVYPGLQVVDGCLMTNVGIEKVNRLLSIVPAKS